MNQEVEWAIIVWRQRVKEVVAPTEIAEAAFVRLETTCQLIPPWKIKVPNRNG